MRVIQIDCLAQREVWRQIARCHIAACGEDKSPGFHGVGTCQTVSPEKFAFEIRFFQLRSGMKGKSARENGNVEVLALLDHASANERHEMLAANQAPDTADVSLVSDQVCAVAGAPDGALDESGHGLAV